MSAIIHLIGRVGNDPSSKNVNGIQVAEFSLAVNTNKKDDKPEWYKVALFGERWANVLNYIKKGNQLYVSGDLSHSTYTGKDGNTYHQSNVRANTITLIGSKQESNPAPNANLLAEIAAIQELEDFNDDLPF